MQQAVVRRKQFVVSSSPELDGLERVKESRLGVLDVMLDWRQRESVSWYYR